MFSTDPERERERRPRSTVRSRVETFERILLLAAQLICYVPMLQESNDTESALGGRIVLQGKAVKIEVERVLPLRFS